MIRTAVYYQENDQDTIDNVVEYIKGIIEKLENNKERKITGVFIDVNNDNSEFLEMIDSYINQIDQVILLSPLEGEFEKELLYKLEDSGRVEFITKEKINWIDEK